MKGKTRRILHQIGSNQAFGFLDYSALSRRLNCFLVLFYHSGRDMITVDRKIEAFVWKASV